MPLRRRVVPRLAARTSEAAVIDNKGGQTALGGERRGELVQAHLRLRADAVGHDDDGRAGGGAVEGALWGVEPGLSLLCEGIFCFCWLVERGSRWMREREASERKKKRMPAFSRLIVLSSASQFSLSLFFLFSLSRRA